MEPIMIVGLISGALISLFLSKTLLSYGKSIDQYPVAGQETREISLWSPLMFTRISVLVFWPCFILGSLMVIQQSRFMLVGGIALITGLLLYLVTAVIFSAAVFNAMASAGRGSDKSNPVPGMMGRLKPFSSGQDIGSRFRSLGNYSRPGYKGYRK
jgi:hypothetical protein